MISLDSIASQVAGYNPEALPVPLARAIIGQLAMPVAALDTVSVRQALNRVLAHDVIAPIDVPAYDNSAMDGFAFASTELAQGDTAALQVAGIALAGRPFIAPVPAGSCVRVMTGAVMPPGCDTVIPQEAVQRFENAANGPQGIRFATAGLAAGANRRSAGEDLARGSIVLHEGRILRPSDLGLIASLGVGTVTVRRRLRVAYFSTGDELRSLGEPLELGCVYDSNRYTIDAMLRRLDIEPIDLGVVRDDPAAIEAALRQAAACGDAILTSGGISVGDADFVKPMMHKLGETLFWKLAMRPGRPMALGRIGRDGRESLSDDSPLLFGLPGNPVAVMVGFYQLVRPALLQMMGVDAPSPPRIAARMVEPIAKRANRTEFLRGLAERNRDGSWSVRLAGAQGSGVLRSMSDANCVIELEHERGPLAAGETVDIVFFEALL